MTHTHFHGHFLVNLG